MFEQLLKYPIDIFRQGRLLFRNPPTGTHSIPHLRRLDRSLDMGIPNDAGDGRIGDFGAF